MLIADLERDKPSKSDANLEHIIISNAKTVVGRGSRNQSRVDGVNLAYFFKVICTYSILYKV